MKNTFFSILYILFLLAIIISCGDSTEFLIGSDRYAIDVIALADGDTLVRPANEKSDAHIFFRIRGEENSGSDLTLLSTLYNSQGESVARHEKTSPAINADSPISLSPELAAGQYELELSLMRGETLLQRERRVFFLVKQAPQIQGILSYPLVIFPARPALLIADIESAAGLDPYLKWTEGKKVIAKGPLREGYDQILWESSQEDGVYAVQVEVYPFPPPAGGDFTFSSPAKAEAELFISLKDQVKAVARPAELKYNLFDVYISALRERERVSAGAAGDKSTAVSHPLRQPQPVILGETIGMKFDGQAGFICPEIIFPMRAASVEPFTLEWGVKFEGDTPGRKVMSLGTNDASVQLTIAFNEDGELFLRWKTKSDEYLFPSGIAKPQAGLRSLIELSILPAGGRTRVVWKLNGAVVSQAEKTIIWESASKKGYTIIGGDASVRCSIDTLNIVLE